MPREEEQKDGQWMGVSLASTRTQTGGAIVSNFVVVVVGLKGIWVMVLHKVDR